MIKKFADDSGHTAAEPERSGDSQPQAARRANEVRQVYTNRTVVHLMTSSIARMNCFLHGIEDFRIERGDTLAEPKLVQGDRLMRFDVVLANPPYSIKQWDRDAFASDPWGRNLYGTPPQGRADYAFQAAHPAKPQAQDRPLRRHLAPPRHLPAGGGGNAPQTHRS
jgi:hypothetical protein